MRSLTHHTFRLSFLAVLTSAALTQTLFAKKPALNSDEAQGARQPNILFIMADDLGYGDLGCYGQHEIQTPNIDRMAEEGMRFTQCYAGSTVCGPTRCVLLTGKHTGHSRVRGNMGFVGPERMKQPISLRSEDVTVAEVLRQAGYATGVVGKWGVGARNSAGIPNRQGFDQWLGFLDQRHAHGYYPEFIWRNEEMVPLEGNLGGHQQEWIHDKFTDFSLDFIRTHKDGPFFLYMAYTIPHGRYEIPSDAPYSEKSWPADIRNYAAMVTRLDSDVGRVMTLLKELGIDDNTLVFFTSDNGAEIHYFREAGIVDEYERTLQSPGPLRGWKRDLTDGGIRVPMIARWPGRVPVGVTSDYVWAFWDFLATAADVAGVQPAPDTDGVSILPTLLGKPQPEHEFLYWEFFERGFQQAVRYGEFKAIRLKQGAPLELYRVTDDLKEQHNVADEYPEVVAKIEKHLETARTPTPFWPE